MPDLRLVNASGRRFGFAGDVTTGGGGAGTVGYFPYWEAASTLSVNSLLFQDVVNSRLGFNTNAPAVPVHFKFGDSTAPAPLFTGSVILEHSGQLTIKLLTAAKMISGFIFADPAGSKAWVQWDSGSGVFLLDSLGILQLQSLLDMVLSSPTIVKLQAANIEIRKAAGVLTHSFGSYGLSIFCNKAWDANEQTFIELFAAPAPEAYAPTVCAWIGRKSYSAGGLFYSTVNDHPTSEIAQYRSCACQVNSVSMHLFRTYLHDGAGGSQSIPDTNGLFEIENNGVAAWQIRGNGATLWGALGAPWFQLVRSGVGGADVDLHCVGGLLTLKAPTGLGVRLGVALDGGLDVSITGQTGLIANGNKYLQLDFTNVVFDANIFALLGHLTLNCAAGHEVQSTDDFRAKKAWACNNETPQTKYAGGNALAAYVTGAFGLDSDAHMQALYDKVVAIETALVNNGIMSQP